MRDSSFSSVQGAEYDRLREEIELLRNETEKLYLVETERGEKR